MHEFNQSLKYDKRMYDADIRGSIAYSKALTLVGILTKDEEVKIVNGLEAVKKEWDDGAVSPNSTIRVTTNDVYIKPYSSRPSQMTRTSTPRTRGD